jgi:hypothetical protein
MSSQLQVSGEAKIRDIQGPVVANSGVITALDGAASQYVRGDGTLADFPTSSGGGSSVSYYLNSSVSQGTIGGVAYRQLGKTPIAGAGTDIVISANGYVASYLTDANDPALLEVPAGNFNCEFYFAVNSNNHDPYVYAEVYKYDGTTFTLIGSSQSVPEYLTNGTTLSPYYFAIPVTQTTLAITDRIAIRIYVNVDGRVVTLHTENNHLCQVVTTFSKGLTSLNNLTRQVQFFGTGTSGTDFNISSVTATHTFNLPIASATNTGKLSSTDWSTFNNKQAALSFTAPLVNTSNTISIPAATSLVDGYLDNLDWTNFNTAYNNMIVSAAVTGTTTKTLTLTQQDAGTITASWTDDNTDAVTSVFGRTGAVVATSGDYNTSQVTENTNLYFTDARARGALSFTAGSGAYNSTTGVITIPTNNNQITNGSNFITLTSLSGGTGISYNNTTGVITNSAPDQTVSLTAGAGISISGSYPSFTIASTITQYTDALARAAISLTTTGTSGAATYNSTTGVFNIPNYAPDLSGYVPTSRTITINGTSFDLSANRTYSVGTVTSVGLSSATSGVTIGSSPITTSGTITLAIATASGSQNGLLSSTDWTTFNNKQSALTNPVTGTGTTNYLPKFTGASTIGNSIIQDDTTNIDVAGFAYFRRAGKFLILNPNYNAASVYADIAAESGMDLSLSANGATKQLYLTQSGNLGLGVTPSDTLSYGRALDIQGTAGSALYVRSGTNSSTVYGLFSYDNNTVRTNIGGIGTGNYLRFISGGSEAMRLNASGNLAVGTTTDAGYKLDVNGTGRFTGALTGTSATFSGTMGVGTTSPFGKFNVVDGTNKSLVIQDAGVADTIELVSYSTSGGIRNMAISASTLTFATGTAGGGSATTRLTIASTGAATFASSVTAAGAITLNNASANYATLNLNGAAGYGAELKFGEATGGYLAAIRHNFNVGTGLEFYTGGLAVGNLRMYIAPTGNVGIGTSSPSGILQVQGVQNGVSGKSLRLAYNSTYYVDYTENSINCYNNDFIIGTGSSATERMRITSGGNVLIGTSTDNAGKLQVNGEIRMYGSTLFRGMSSNTLQLCGGTSSSNVKIDGSVEVVTIDTNGSERMRITSGGKVNINNTSNTNYQLYVDGGSSPAFAAYSTSPNNQFKLAGTAPGLTISNTITSPTIGGALGACTSANDFITGTAAGDMILINQYTGNKLYITNYSGGVYLTQGATSWTANSDIRIKNINSHITNAVEKLSTLQTINFCYKDDISKKENLGLIAQEVEMVFPELIETNNDGILGVRYTELIPVLIEAIKEQQEQIKELKLELDKIKNK